MTRLSAIAAKPGDIVTTPYGPAVVMERDAESLTVLDTRNQAIRRYYGSERERLAIQHVYSRSLL